MRKSITLVSLALLVAAAGQTRLFAADADDQVVGPIADKTKYVVSPRGAHLATVAPKGSRVNVIVDGVAGPRFDDIVEAGGVIDPRPWKGVDVNDQPRSGPVMFSKDGSRYAYVGRLGQEWVLIADNKEVLRIPAAGTGTTGVLIEFTGEGGRHLLFARSVYGGFEFWSDGQKWPGLFGSGGGGGEGTIDPLISPDGEHVAYVAQIDREKRAVILDGKQAGYLGHHLQFTPDSKHLICISDNPKGQAVLVDGKQLIAASQVIDVYVAPVGHRLAFSVVHLDANGGRAGVFLLIDGKPVQATLTPNGIVKFLFSPDGKHYAAICGPTGTQFVVIDGKKGQEYLTVTADDVSTLSCGMAFSGDSTKLAYTAATLRGGQFVIVNDDESDALGNPWFRFSPDGKHVAYGGIIIQPRKSVLMIDGKALPLPPGWDVSSFTFSPDGSRYAFLGQQAGNKGIFLDGKNTGLNGDFAFSPDSKHFAVSTMTTLNVDGQFVFKIDSVGGTVLNQAFSPDSEHLFWITREPAIGAKAAPGAYECVAYVDGQQVARCDSVMDAPGTVRTLYGYRLGSTWKIPAALNVTATGKFTFLGPLDDGIKRFTVAPPAGANVEAMIAGAKTPGAKTKSADANSPGKPAHAASPAQAAAQSAPGLPATNAASSMASNAPVTPATPDPAADAASMAKAKVDAAAAKAKSLLESFTRRKK